MVPHSLLLDDDLLRTASGDVGSGFRVVYVGSHLSEMGVDMSYSMSRWRLWLAAFDVVVARALGG